MSKGSTLFLKFVIVLMGMPILAGCIYGLSRFDPDSPFWATEELAKLQYPLLIGMYATMIPFFIALFQTLKLLSYIDRDQAFSQLSIKTLKTIKYCAVAVSMLFTVEMPFFYLLTKADDAPGVLIGAVIIFASLVVAVFAAVLQKLLQDAIRIKEENDLIV